MTHLERIESTKVLAGLPKATFSFDHFFTVEFDRKTTTQKTTQKTAQKTTQKTTQKLSATQLDILNLIAENPMITRKELAEKMDEITESGVKYNLKKLQDLKVLKRVGKTKGGYWKIIKK